MADRMVPYVTEGLKADVDERRSHKQRDEADVVASSGVSDIELFQQILDRLESSKAEFGLLSAPSLPIRGDGLCPLASQTRTPGPRTAAKCNMFDEFLLPGSLGSKANEDIVECWDEAFVAWLKMSSGTCGRDM